MEAQISTYLLKYGAMGVLALVLFYLLLQERKRVDRFADAADKMATAMQAIANGFAEMKGILLGKERS